MDMLVKLYELPSLEREMERMDAQGVSIQKAFPPDRHQIVEWVRRNMGTYAAGEADCSFKDRGTTMYLAVKDGRLIGFACYDATAPDFFGPTMVIPEFRGLGIGKALLVASMHAMRAEGYAYAMIGDAGPSEFYSKAVGAICIPDSTPGPYRDFLKLED